MKKTNLKMRILSMFLCLLMVFTSIPATAFAAEIDIADVSVESFSGEAAVSEESSGDGEGAKISWGGGKSRHR